MGPWMCQAPGPVSPHPGHTLLKYEIITPTLEAMEGAHSHMPEPGLGLGMFAKSLASQDSCSFEQVMRVLALHHFANPLRPLPHLEMQQA